MIVQGTSKIRGVLSVPLDKAIMEITPGATRHLSQEDFNKHEVQQALAMGYLKAQQPPIQPANVTGATTVIDGERKIKCRNAFNRPLTMSLFQFPINAGQDFMLTEKQLAQAEIKQAIAQGYIKVLEAQSPAVQSAPHVAAETTLNVMSKVAMEQAQINEKAKAKRHLDSNHVPLETNEEIATPTQVVNRQQTVKNVDMQSQIIDTDTPKPVQAPDVQHNAVVWNPSGKPIMNTMKGNVVNVGGEEVTFVDQQQHPEEEITFVDQQQQAEKIAAHPKLKAPEPDADPVFVDQQQEAERVAAHPKLDQPAEEGSGSTFVPEL